MGVEIEKKYRLGSRDERERLRQHLAESGATPRGEEFEENILFAGTCLDPLRQVLRVRRVSARAVLTYKESVATDSAVKRRREDETTVADADALIAILAGLGLTPALVYEKRRETWDVADVEVVVDELPFGLFVEIEGEEGAIGEAEKLLGLSDAEVEHASYPELTRRHGVKKGNVTEARF